MTDDDESREQGVEFGPLADELEAESYPLTKADLLDSYGDREIGLEEGTQTVQEIIAPLGEDKFESAEEVRDTLIGMAGEGAVGRDHYSDRGGQAPDDEVDESV